MSRIFAVTAGVVCCALLAGLLILAIACQSQTEGRREQGGEPAWVLSGPYTHDNLSLFLMHAKEVKDTTDYLTLNEGLTQKTVVISEVSESGDVNTLHIENQSQKLLYVQSGDIIKGGKQDRSIAVDFIVPPKSGKVPVAAFCVEPHRWNNEKGAERGVFSASVANAPSPVLKMAIKEAGNDSLKQQLVWEKNAESIEKLKGSLGAPWATQGDDSMAKVAGSEEVRRASEASIHALKETITGKHDVVGLVVVINGEVQSADLYPNPSLFRKLWDSNLRSAAIAALAGKKDSRDTKTVTRDEVFQFLSAPAQAQAQDRPIEGKISMKRREADKNIEYETLLDGKTIHTNWLKK